MPKRIGRDAIAAKLLKRVNQAQQKFRLRRRTCKHLQPRAHLLDGNCHHKKLSAGVGLALGCAALYGKYAAGQPRKTQNLGIAADPVAALCAQKTLGIVGKLLRRDQNLPAAPCLGSFADASKRGACAAFTILAQCDLQHVLTSCIYHIINPCEKIVSHREKDCVGRAGRA